MIFLSFSFFFWEREKKQDDWSSIPRYHLLLVHHLSWRRTQKVFEPINTAGKAAPHFPSQCYRPDFYLWSFSNSNFDPFLSGPLIDFIFLTPGFYFSHLKKIFIFIFLFLCSIFHSTRKMKFSTHASTLYQNAFPSHSPWPIDGCVPSLLDVSGWVCVCVQPVW